MYTEHRREPLTNSCTVLEYNVYVVVRTNPGPAKNIIPFDSDDKNPVMTILYWLKRGLARFTLLRVSCLNSYLSGKYARQR